MNQKFVPIITQTGYIVTNNMPTPSIGAILAETLLSEKENKSASNNAVENATEVGRQDEVKKEGAMTGEVADEKRNSEQRSGKRLEFLSKCLKGRSRVCLEIPQNPEDHPSILGSPRIGFCMDITQDIETGGYLIWLESITPPGSTGSGALKVMLLEQMGETSRVAYVRNDKINVVVNAAKNLRNEEEELALDETLETASLIGEVIRSRSLDSGQSRDRWRGML